MATQIDLYLAEGQVPVATGDAVAFYGDSGFGDNIGFGEYNGRTFVSDVSGVVSRFEGDNCKFLDSSGVIVGQVGTGIRLQELPNFLATLNIRFITDTASRAQNAFLRADSGDDISAPSGVDVFAAEVLHTGLKQDNTGTGDTDWQALLGSGTELGLIDSPGTSGLRPLGPATIDTRHDWYVAMTVTPTLPGDKTFKITVQLEFL